MVPSIWISRPELVMLPRSQASVETPNMLLRRPGIRLLKPLTLGLLAAGLGACSSKPMVPYTTDATPQVMLPASRAGIDDQRGRFREIVCAVLEARGSDCPATGPATRCW